MAKQMTDAIQLPNWVDWTRVVEGGLLFFTFFVMFRKFNHLVEFVFFIILGILILVRVSEKNLQVIPTSLNLPIVLYLSWVLIAIPFATDPLYSLIQWKKALAPSLIFFFAVSFIRDEAQVRRLLFALGGGVLVLAVVGSVEYFYSTKGLTQLGTPNGSWTPGQTYFSSYLVIVFPFVVLGFIEARDLRVKFLLGITIPASVIALFCTHTRGAWVAIFIQAAGTFVLLVLKRGRGIVFAGLGVGVLVGTIFLALSVSESNSNKLIDNTSMKIRATTWRLALSDIVDYPIVGLGYGRDSFDVFHEISGHDPLTTGLASHTHNEFLAAAVETGIPGFILFTVMFFIVLRETYKGWTGIPKSFIEKYAFSLFIMTVGMMVRNMFDQHHTGTLAYLFWLMVGCYFGLRAAQVHIRARE